MGKLKDELKTKLESITQIYILTQELYFYTEYFHNPNTREESDLIEESVHSIHLRFIKHIMFRTLINELAKLFSRSENDKYRLSAFIDSLSESGHYRNLKFSKEKVVLWKEKLDNQSNVIDSVLTLRSKVYAHTDFSLGFNNTDITFKEIKSLLDFALKIIQEVYGTIFDTELDAESGQFDRERFTMLSTLAKGEECITEELTKEFMADISKHKEQQQLTPKFFG